MEIPIENRSKCFDLELFLRGYYGTVFKSPESADEYYRDTSVLARPDTNGVLNSVKTVQAIKDMILSLDFKKYEVEIKSTVSQESHEGGMVILVRGNLMGQKDDMQKKFAQSIFLAPQDKGSYIVNDVLMYVHENGSLELQSFPTTIEHHSIFIPSLPLNVSVTEVEEELKKFGSIKPGGVQVRTNTFLGHCFGVVEFEAFTSMKRALQAPYVKIGDYRAFLEQYTNQFRDMPMQYSNHAVTMGSSVDMPMPFAHHHAATLKAHSIGSYFVQAYYHNLFASPEKVHKFYEDTSMLARPDIVGDTKSVTFQIASTENMIFPWDLKEYDAELKSSDAQECYESGFMVLVTGCLKRRNDQKEKNFVQSFILAPRVNGYFVFTDVFRYVDDKESLSQHRFPATVRVLADYFASELDREPPFEIYYYNTLCQFPEAVQIFYKDTCVSTRPDKCGTMKSVTTKQAITDMILSLDFNDYDAKLESSVSLRSYNGGTLVLVTGFFIKRQDKMPKRWLSHSKKWFAQSFFLAPSTDVVLNDILRYFHEKPFVPQSIPPTFNVTVESSESDNSTSGSESTEVSWHSSDLAQGSEKFHASRVRLWRYKWCKIVYPNEKRTRQVTSGSSALASTSTPLIRTCCCKRKSNKPSCSCSCFCSNQPAPHKPTGKWILCCPSAVYGPANKEEVTSRNTEQHEVDSAQPASAPISSNATATRDSRDEVERHSIFIPRLLIGTSVAEVEEKLKTFGSIKPGGVQVLSTSIKTCFRCGGVQVTSTTDEDKDKDEVKEYCFSFVEFEELSSMKKALEKATVIIGGEEALIYQESPQLLELEAVMIGGVSGKERIAPYRRSARDGNSPDRGRGWEEVSSEEDDDKATSYYIEEESSSEEDDEEATSYYMGCWEEDEDKATSEYRGGG